MAALPIRHQKKVCKICFNSSSHKSIPFLTPESKSRVDAGKKKKCSQCHQEWISITVCREPGTGKWVHVRSNFPKNVVMCRFIRRSGTKICPIGQSCSFAHNKAEVARLPSLPSSTGTFPNSTKTPVRSMTLSSQTSVTIRKRPVLSCQIVEYKLCKYVEAGRRCVHGDFCTFAHGQNELNEWNKDLNNCDSDYNSIAKDVAISEEESDSLDYASKVRSELVAMHRQGFKLSGIEETHENVTIKEISGTELSRIGDDQKQYEWTFEVTVSTTQTLTSVVLFDSLSHEFQINSITHLSMNESSHKQVQLLDEMKVKTDQKIEPKERVQVKITLNAHPGILNQFVLFEFGSIFRHFIMVRGFCVYVPSDLEKKLLLSPKLMAKPDLDLHWERHYKEILMETYPFQEETDELLPQYALPENLVGSNDKIQLQGCLTKENYKERMHCLLYFEEHEHKKIMSRYDLDNIVIESQDIYEDHLQGGTSYAPKGQFFVKLSLEEDLFEGTRSIRSGDDARILIPSKNEVHQCVVEHVGRDYAVLLITESTKKACSENNHCSVRFVPSRLPVRAMHYAIDNIDLDTIFPLASSASDAVMSNPTAIKKCSKELNKSKLNPLQKEVISTMFKPEAIKIPTLVLGPFGVGKTRTLCESIKLITWNFPDTHILVCTHSNSAANLYVKDIHTEWTHRGENELAPMLRLYFTKRRLASIPTDVKRYCKMEGNKLVIPKLAEIKRSRIVVTTLITSRILFLKGLESGHFSHIIIDEAAQALEPEAIIPLCLANHETKIVLAGDHLQLVPPMYSAIAKQHDFHITLLERLYDNDAYKSTNELISQCKNLLTMNYRSCQEILALPSRLFYNTELVSCASFPPRGLKHVQAVRFIGVSGQECRDPNSPSYYNDREADEATEQAKYLTEGGLKQDDICVLAYDHMQVIQLRRFLRKAKLSSVKVYRVDDVQGEEFRALIVSTVRTCTKEPPPEEDAGFLTNAKLLNTAITRAREWLVIIGEPITLCTVGSNRLCWMEFIKQCCRQGTFEYSLANAEQFEVNLENKLVLRNMLGKQYENLMKELMTNYAKPKQVKDFSIQDPSVTSLDHSNHQKQSVNTNKLGKEELGIQYHSIPKSNSSKEEGIQQQARDDLTIPLDNLSLDKNDTIAGSLHTETDDGTLQDQTKCDANTVLEFEDLPVIGTHNITSLSSSRNQISLEKTDGLSTSLRKSHGQDKSNTDTNPLHQDLATKSESSVSHAQNVKVASLPTGNTTKIVSSCLPTTNVTKPPSKPQNVQLLTETRGSHRSIRSQDSWSLLGIPSVSPVPTCTTATSIVWQAPVISPSVTNHRSAESIPLMNISPQYGAQPFQSTTSSAASPQMQSLWQIPDSRSVIQATRPLGDLSNQQGQQSLSYQDSFSGVSLNPVQFNTAGLLQPLTLTPIQTSYGSNSPTYNWPSNSGPLMSSMSLPRNASTYLSPMAPTFVPQARPARSSSSYNNSQLLNVGYHPRQPHTYAMQRALLPTPTVPVYNKSQPSFNVPVPSELNISHNIHQPSPRNIQNPGLSNLSIHQNVHRTNVGGIHNTGLSSLTVPQSVHRSNTGTMPNPGLSHLNIPQATPQSLYNPGQPIPQTIHPTNPGNIHNPGPCKVQNLQSTDPEEYQKIEDVTVYTDQLIGHGAFGHVFKGELNGMQCAVKVLNSVGIELLTRLPTASNSTQFHALEKFERECEYLQMIQHKNIVRYIATRTFKKKTAQLPVLVMELLNCNLRKYLQETEEIKLFIQVSLSVDVASGLEFLHDTERKIVHRDLCGDNILLSTDSIIPVAKISDFGLSRIIDFETMSRSLSALGHRNGYLPPEANLLSPNNLYDSSLDIFMFGAVMTQIATKIPHIQDTKERQKLVSSIKSDHPLRDIIVGCLDDNRSARPNAGKVRIVLCERLMQYMK